MHKTLGSLQSICLINVGKNSKIKGKKVQNVYHLLSSTSPNILLLVDCESTVATMANCGNDIVSKAIRFN